MNKEKVKEKLIRTSQIQDKFPIDYCPEDFDKYSIHEGWCINWCGHRDVYEIINCEIKEKCPDCGGEIHPVLSRYF
jgi:hypothetical protein